MTAGARSAEDATPTSARTGHRRGPLRLLATATASQASASVMMQGLPALAVFIQAGLGLSAVETGSLTAASSVASVFFLLVAGRLLDQRPERQVMILGAAVMAAAATTAAATPGYAFLLVALIVVGIGYSTAQVGGNRTIVETVPSTRLGLAIGVRQAGLPLGGAVGAATLPVVAATANWRVALIVAAGCVLAGAVAFWWAHGSEADGADTTNPTSSHDSVQNAASGWRASARSALTELQHIAADRPICRSVGLGVVLMAAQTAVLVFLIGSLLETSELPLSYGAAVLVVVMLGGAAGRVVLTAWARTRWIDSGGVLGVTTFAVAVSLTVIALAPQQPSIELLACGAAWTGFFTFGWFGPWVMHLIELAPDQKLGQTLGIAMACAQLAIVATPLILGVARDATDSYALGWVALSGLTCITALLWVGGRACDRVNEDIRGDSHGPRKAPYRSI